MATNWTLDHLGSSYFHNKPLSHDSFISHTIFTHHIPTWLIPKADQTCSFGCHAVFFCLPTTAHHLSSPHYHLVHETHHPPPTTFSMLTVAVNCPHAPHHMQTITCQCHVTTLSQSMKTITCHIIQMVTMHAIVTICSMKLSSPTALPHSFFHTQCGGHIAVSDTAIVYGCPWTTVWPSKNSPLPTTTTTVTQPPTMCPRPQTTSTSTTHIQQWLSMYEDDRPQTKTRWQWVSTHHCLPPFITPHHSLPHPSPSIT